MLQNMIKVPQVITSGNQSHNQKETMAKLEKGEDLQLHSEFRHTSIILALLANVNSARRQVLDHNINNLFKQKVLLGRVETTDLHENKVLMEALMTLLVQTMEHVSLTPFPSDVHDQDEG